MIISRIKSIKSLLTLTACPKKHEDTWNHWELLIIYDSGIMYDSFIMPKIMYCSCKVHKK